ncbi:hypothetical protein SEA_SPEEDDEMON_1540 [Gordonia phage SpeedDemon]|nr:hypothetical protein SEA_SPEEDDEMON_1540 [Gordonia phage SpeedDemon]
MIQELAVVEPESFFGPRVFFGRKSSDPRNEPFIRELRLFDDALGYTAQDDDEIPLFCAVSAHYDF